jgi:dTDP-4-dehydrorhamnose 3,5-epimerase
MNADDLIPEAKKVLLTQKAEKQVIDGVKIASLKKHITEDGSFTELMRLRQLPFSDFTIAQINRSVMLPNTIKAWHLHFHQDEVWNTSSESHILLGLWDIREHSATKGISMRIPLSSETLVLIPRGVAHGAANHMTHKAEILYFVSNEYDKDHPDEHRLAWDLLGKEFWEIKKE